jgi:hypothetical protein
MAALGVLTRLRPCDSVPVKLDEDTVKAMLEKLEEERKGAGNTGGATLHAVSARPLRRDQ